MSLIEQFKKLHKQSTPLLLANVWDAHSAILAEKAGFQALGTSSHAIANMLGYEDGESMPVELLFTVVERIIAVAGIPVSVDFEAGYSQDAEKVAEHVKRLVNMGVVGINLEDGTVKNGKRNLGDAKHLEEKIAAIKQRTKVFINARIDTYTTKHKNKLDETLKRANSYKDAGASGIFVPLMEAEADIKSFTTEIPLPLNLFASPTLPPIEKLREWGVKRVSHGGNYYEKMMAETENFFKDFYKNKDFEIF